MAFAGLVTGRPEFIEKSKLMAMDIVGKETWSSEADHRAGWKAGLMTGHCIAETTLVYDWLYHQWSEQERAAIRTAIHDKGFAPYLDDMHGGARWIEWYTCNGMCVVNGPILMAAILLGAEMDTREVHDLGLMQIRRAIDAHCRDGGYPESTLYWNYCVRHMLLGVEPLRRLEGIDLYKEPFLHTTCNYPLHFNLPNLVDTTNSADGYSSTHLWSPIAALAARTRNPEFQWLARQLIRHDWGDDGEGLEYSLFYLLFYEPELADRKPSETTYLFGGLQQLSMRTGWDRDAAHVVWLNGPSNCHHNHLHLNSFTMSAFSERLLVECGKFDYSNNDDYRKQTAGHNSLLVNGEGQIIATDTDIFCRRIRAGEWGTVFGEFRCLRQEAGLTVGTGSTVDAYAGRLRSFDRTLAFSPAGFVFLHDWIELAGAPPARLDWLFHSAGSLELESGGARFTNGQAHMRLIYRTSLVTDASIGNDHSELVPDGEPRPLPYLRITARCETTTADLYALLVPHREGGEPEVTLRMTIEGAVFGCGRDSWQYHSGSRKLARL